ncbi:MAG: site-2 protease family protein [Clostridia bacterium]|nr:site-2 protease family protein [Clostridia bacterium]
MSLIWTIILTVLIFGALIFVHELGHYLVARSFGIGIREFAIGMGPKLFSWKGKKNVFSLRAFPIGGFVDTVGEMSSDTEPSPEDEGKTPFNTKPLWQRFLVVLAGPFMNVVIGLLVMAVIVVSQPILASTIIASFSEDSYSTSNLVYVTESFGDFEKGDIILSVNGEKVTAEDGIEAFEKTVGSSPVNKIEVVRKNSDSIKKELTLKGVSVPTEFLSLNEQGYIVFTQATEQFEKGDIILKANGAEIKNGQTLESFIETYGSKNLDSLVLLRENGNYFFENVSLDYSKLAVSDSLEINDKVLSVEGDKIRVYTDLSYAVMNKGSEPVSMTVLRGEETVKLENVIFPKFAQSGIVFGECDFKLYRQEKTFSAVAYNAVFQSLTTLRMTVESLIDTFRGRYGIEALSGPVGIGSAVGEAAKSSSPVSSIMSLLATVSLSLGIANLLPLPVLDGGRLLLFIIEAVRRKPLSEKVEQTLMAASMLLVLGLMAIIMFKDIVNLF